MFDHGQPSYADVNKDIISTMLETGPKYWMLFLNDGAQITAPFHA